jgi:hydrogenase-4 component F
MRDFAIAFAIPFVGAGIVLLSRTRRLRLGALLATTAAHLVETIRLWGLPRGASDTPLIGIDAAGLLMLSVISFLYFVVAIHLIAYTRRETRGAPAVFLSCHLYSLAALTLACGSSHWGLFWVAMEGATLAAAPLLFYHHGARSLEATWKYVIIGSVGIALALMGTLFLGAATVALPKGADVLSYDAMILHAPKLSVPWVKMAAVFLIVGYGTKMGLAPVHTWKPDAYGEAPPPVAALLSGGITNCAFLGLFRVSQLCNAVGEGAFVRTIFLGLGVLSLAVAAASILGQGNYRRMLAYSSVEHMGILSLAIGVGGGAVFGGMLHAVNNAVNKGILFLAAGNVLQARRTSEVKAVRGLFRTLPFSGTLFAMGFFAACGFPPFGTFVSEFAILRGMFAQGSPVIALLFLGFLAVVFIGMGTIVLEMVQGKAEGERTREPLLALLPILLLVACALMLGVHIPAPLLRLLEEASR